MPIPAPRKGEKKDAFISRCHSALVDEFDDQTQRHAVCESAWRKKHGGKKPKASRADHFLSVFNVAQELEVRREKLDGVEHLVLPLVALVEGVYQCANCDAPNYYPAAEFAKNVGAWNGRPVTIGHPIRNGNFVSAGSPDVWQTERLGTTFNARLDGRRLCVEAWVDKAAVERAGADAQAVMAAIEDGDQVEVSTAAWIDEAPRVASYGGKKYEAVQINFQPDHIALLKLGERGACNWADGCGVRVAAAALDDEQHCCDACAKGEPCECADDPTDLQSARSLEIALEMSLEAAYGEDTWVMVSDWDDDFVYYMKSGGRGLFRRGYSEDDDGTVTLGDDEKRVRPRADYIVVSSDNKDGGERLAAASARQQEDGEMADTEKKAPAAGQAQPPAQDPATAARAAEPKLSQSEVRMIELEEQVKILKADLATAQSKAPKTAEEFVESAPEGVREFLREGMRMQIRRRLELQGTILKAQGNSFTEDDLKELPVDQLEKLAKLAKPPTDYSIVARDDSRLASMDDGDYAPIPLSPWDKPPTGAAN